MKTNLPDFDPTWRRWRATRAVLLVLRDACERAGRPSEALDGLLDAFARGDGASAAHHLRQIPHDTHSRDWQTFEYAFSAGVRSLVLATTSTNHHTLANAIEWPAAALVALGWDRREARVRVERTFEQELAQLDAPVATLRGRPVYGDPSTAPRPDLWTVERSFPLALFMVEGIRGGEEWAVGDADTRTAHFVLKTREEAEYALARRAEVHHVRRDIRLSFDARTDAWGGHADAITGTHADARTREAPPKPAAVRRRR
jgi:hypothetical protein